MKKLAVVIGLSLAVFGLDYFGLLNWVKGGFSRIVGWRSSLYRALIDQSDEDKVGQQLAECQADLVELKEENAQSRRLLGTKTKPETKFELAEIISLGSGEMTVSLKLPDLVDQSASVVSGPFLVGNMAEIYGKTGRVMLLDSPGTQFPVKIWENQTSSASGVEPVGEGILSSDGQNLYVKEILDSQPIEIGSWVGAVVESGDIFWIGQVEEIFPSEDKIFQEVRISWGVDLSKIITVGVVK